MLFLQKEYKYKYLYEVTLQMDFFLFIDDMNVRWWFKLNGENFASEKLAQLLKTMGKNCLYNSSSCELTLYIFKTQASWLMIVHLFMLLPLDT